MIVCQCNYISKKDIEGAINGFLDKDPWQLITPGIVYHSMQKRGKCCGCFPNVIGIIIETASQYHQALATPTADVIFLIDRIKTEHQKTVELKKRLVAA